MVEVNYTDPDEFPLPRIPNFNAVARAVLQAYRNTLIQIYTDEIIPARQGETSLQDLTGNIPTLLTDVGVLQTTVAGLSAGSGLIVVAGEPVTTLDTGLTVVGDISKEVVGNVGSKRLQLTVNFPQKLSIQNLGQQATDQTIDATSENGWVRVEPTSNLTINFTDVQEGTIFQTEIKGIYTQVVDRSEKERVSEAHK